MRPSWPQTAPRLSLIHILRGAFELAKACFVLLAERYPENVRFADVSRRGKESMMDLQLFAACLLYTSRKDVSHGHEGGDTCHDLGLDIGVVLLQMKDVF